MSELLKQEKKRKFDKFWDIVQNTANAQGKKFFLDCGEGHEFFLDDIEGEDLRGWLVSLEEAEAFEQEWKENNVSDKWIDSIFWAEWKDVEGRIEVEFNTF